MTIDCSAGVPLMSVPGLPYACLPANYVMASLINRQSDTLIPMILLHNPMLCFSGARTLVSLWYQGFGEVEFLRECTRHANQRFSQSPIPGHPPDPALSHRHGNITAHGSCVSRRSRCGRGRAILNSTSRRSSELTWQCSDLAMCSGSAISTISTKLDRNEMMKTSSLHWMYSH